MRNKLLICFAIILQISAKAQEKFNLTIQFPTQLQTSQISVVYHNGIEEKTVKVSSSSMNITDYFYSKYATIVVSFDSNSIISSASHTFYLSHKVASLTYEITPKKKELEYKLTNALDANVIAKQYNRFIEKENEDINEFNRNDTISDATVSFNMNEALRKKLIQKQLTFINKHRNQYYSFQIFKNYIAPSIFSNADSLYGCYKNMFPIEFINTIEGKNIEEQLLGRTIANHENIKAIDFCTSDIYNNKICSQDLRGKYVLINFWASWCGPCVAELPSIKEIKEKYNKDSLVVISVNIDKDSAKFLQAVKKYKIDWINVYRDFSLGTKFGGLVSIPVLFLIDKSGNIIYNKNYRQDFTAELPILKSVLREKLFDGNSGLKAIFDKVENTEPQ